MPTSAESYTLWAIALVAAVVVLAVVVVTLSIILSTASKIDGGARQIWTVGKNVANCTIQLSRLQRTNQLVADVIEAATGILHNAGRIAAHAQTCAGCPRCVTAPAAAPPHVDGSNMVRPPSRRAPGSTR